MSNDWIKWRVGLTEDPAVVAIAAELGLDEFAVAGRLGKLWAWADQHVADGHARGVTDVFIDRLVRADGFARAMENAGWLEVKTGKKNEVSFPNYERHMSENAKRRALAAERQRKKRNAESVTEALPEKEKEKEKETKRGTTRARGRKAGVEPDWAALLDRWNNEIRVLVGAPKVIRFTDKMKAQYRARVKTNPGLFDEIAAALRIADSDFGKRREDGKWWFSLQWCLKSEDNLLKFLAGNYFASEQGARKREFAVDPETGLFAEGRT